MAEWIKECVLLRGAINRLSMSGHLLRFVVDRKLNLEYQACAIDLPAVAKKWLHGCIGLSSAPIKFMTFDKNLCLCIWVLTGTYE
ncbi:hypothetical protein TIFTF001_054109 [Ficus carica]|uniref:Uncharacterized protein n=1 Tax=Ficus carica TaxID=3494 RepID=A0AA88JCA0_FICCA|nr:hypothetical protein TIFTF001_054106 [Ficus carica]GMN71498.1 hypothetical protein TIFTF001_054107 [Ficus carica]GMN71505.1 hypothetical protein TIFTF001_054108 [Ficus carica]GMN71507.1 hypothetical protein TIFTF001_054109 [Ficus carica]